MYKQVMNVVGLYVWKSPKFRLKKIHVRQYRRTNLILYQDCET